MVPTTSSSTLENAMPKYFEGYGLRIPLIRRGQRVPHARLASELATGSNEKLSAIVQDFLQAASKATKLIKTLHSKKAISEWIESAETLALGPHPESKLHCVSIAHTYKTSTNEVAATKKEDLVKALGLKTTTLKVKSTRARKDAPPKKRPDKKHATSPTNNNAVAQSIMSSPSGRESTAVQGESSSPQAEPSHVLGLATEQTLESPGTASEPANTSICTNKRKRDSAAVTTTLEQTRKKKTKTYQAVSPSTVSLPQMGDTITFEAPVLAEQDFPPTSCFEQASHDRDEARDSEDPIRQIDEEASRDTTLFDIVLNLENENTSVVIASSAQDIVITHAFFETYVPEIDWKKQKTGRFETLDGGRTYNKRQSKIAYFTCIPHDYDGDACQQREAGKVPFLKAGHHGRHGDFIDDPDLLTGQGHQVEPADSKRKRAYEVKYRKSYTTRPDYSFVNETVGSLLTNHAEGKTQVVREERWMMEYRDKYQGENVNHLWPCGCERLLDGDESEEE